MAGGGQITGKVGSAAGRRKRRGKSRREAGSRAQHPICLSPRPCSESTVLLAMTLRVPADGAAPTPHCAGPHTPLQAPRSPEAIAMGWSGRETASAFLLESLFQPQRKQGARQRGHSLHWEGAPWPNAVPQMCDLQPSMLRPHRAGSRGWR